MFYEGGRSIGNLPGFDDIQGSVAFGASKTYTAKICSINACTARSFSASRRCLTAFFDQLVVGENLKLGGKLTLTYMNSCIAHAGQTFDLPDLDASNSSFKSIAASGFL